MESFESRQEKVDSYKSDAELDLAEQRFYDSLSSLPPEMAQTWLKKIEDKNSDPDQVVRDFNDFLVLRAKTLRGKVEILPSASESTESQLNHFITLIDSAFENPSHFLGSGRTAKVYSVPTASTTCIKFIVNDSPVDIPVYSEVDILNTLNDFSVEGIRTPTVYFKQIGYGKQQFYGMERVQGTDLSQILANPRKNAELVNIARKMDRDDVIRRLVAYVTEMFKVHRITHGDLKQVNVMLDKNGDLFIIDFGKGKTEELGGDNEKRFLADIEELKREVGAFFVSIDRIEQK